MKNKRKMKKKRNKYAEASFTNWKTFFCVDRLEVENSQCTICFSMVRQ
jgi:hypothetical protein